jgi:hypothetical protein
MEDKLIFHIESFAMAGLAGLSGLSGLSGIMGGGEGGGPPPDPYEDFYIYDSFTGSAATLLEAHTPEKGGPWSVFEAGKSLVLDGAGRAEVEDVVNGNFNYISDGINHGTIELTLRCNFPTDTSPTYGVLMFNQVPDNGYSYYYFGLVGDNVQLIWNDSGSEVATPPITAPHGLSDGATAVLRVEISDNGKALDCFLNGVQIGTTYYYASVPHGERPLTVWRGVGVRLSGGTDFYEADLLTAEVNYVIPSVPQYPNLSFNGTDWEWYCDPSFTGGAASQHKVYINDVLYDSYAGRSGTIPGAAILVDDMFSLSQSNSAGESAKTTPFPAEKPNVLELEDDFNNGPEAFSVHVPDAGGWDISTDLLVNGDGELEFLQDNPTGFKANSLSNGRQSIEFGFQFNDLSGLDVEVSFNFYDIAECWKLVFSPTDIKLYEVTGGVETQRGSTLTLVGDETALGVYISVKENNGDDIAINVGGLGDITYSAVGRPHKNEVGLNFSANVTTPTLLRMVYVAAYVKGT